LLRCGPGFGRGIPITSKLSTQLRISVTNFHSACLLLSALFLPAFAAADHLPEIIVFGHAEQRIDAIDSDTVAMPAPDSAGFMKRIPGGNVNYNGPLSGQTQYHGLFGPRMSVRIDGMYVYSGGPNWMDLPLHYVPAVFLESLYVPRGIASVGSGAGIGGYVEAHTKTSRFTDKPAFSAQGSASVKSHSVDAGRDLGALMGIADNHHRFHALAATEQGDDIDTARGDVTPTQYARGFFGVGYGLRYGEHELSFEVRHDQTDDSGNPTLPMDMSVFDADLFNLGYHGRWNSLKLDARVFYTRIDHRMTNYILRSPPDFSSLPLPPFAGTERRFVEADSDGLGWVLKASLPLAGGSFNFGTDGHAGENNAEVFDPDFAPFFVTNFNNAKTDVYGVFCEWQGNFTNRWAVELGLRYNRVEASTDDVDAFPARIAALFPPGSPPQAVRVLRDRFNALDREQSDDNVDWVAKLGYTLNEATRLELGVARKTRSPSYVERYLWVPLEVNSGLGDGNNYDGDVGLDPEVSHQVELALDWRSGRIYLQPRGFYRRIDDYMQGAPLPMNAFNMPIIGVSANANGDPTPLQFANVDAELYGFDIAWGIRINQAWRIDGLINYTRGERRDIDDDLFRIAPLNTRLAVTYDRPRWFATVEGVFYARQDNISQTITNDPANPNNSNAETPGYGIINLFGQYRALDERLSLMFGVENVFDNFYIDHLSGFNRVAGSAVPVGRRLPGPGRNLFANISLTWE
jgi:iron complex outermembrane receptor protein